MNTLVSGSCWGGVVLPECNSLVFLRRKGTPVNSYQRRVVVGHLGPWQKGGTQPVCAYWSSFPLFLLCMLACPPPISKPPADVLQLDQVPHFRTPPSSGG